jgi:hypothetical protein
MLLRLKADSNYMNAMSSVEVENKKLYCESVECVGKTNYYQWIVWIKIKIANENLLLLEYMIKSMEIRYQYNMDKCLLIIRQSQYSALESMVMLKNEISQKKIIC